MIFGSPELEEILRKATEHLRSRGFVQSDITVILGSGLGTYADTLRDVISVRAGEIPGWPQPTVPGHAGIIHTGKAGTLTRTTRPILVFQGRSHPYEGGDPESFALNIKLARHLGATKVIVTNAAGGVHPKLSPGDIMVHTGIIRLPLRPEYSSVQNEIIGLSPEQKTYYSNELSRILERSAASVGISLASGIYCYMPGPSYETPSEVNMLRLIGADAVGMSTYPEVAEARRLQMDTLGLSLISNQAAGLSVRPLTHEDVSSVATEASTRLSKLLTACLVRIDALGEDTRESSMGDG